MLENKFIVRLLGLSPYELVSQAMHEFTDKRNGNTIDEVWLVEHYPVFTQGHVGKMEHILIQSNIPVVRSDRGGQITYHGPGQQIMYVLLNLKRRKLKVSRLITLLERTVIETLSEYNIHASSYNGAPGVYVQERKICSLGLRIRKGCSLHGLALNVNMDLTPFTYINPCGFTGMKMTQIHQWNSNVSLDIIYPTLIKKFSTQLSNSPYEYIDSKYASI